MDGSVVVVVVVVLLVVVAGVAIVLRGRLSARVRFPWGGGVDVAASRDSAARPAARVVDAESTEGSIAARGGGGASVERARAKRDVTAVGGDVDPKA